MTEKSAGQKCPGCGKDVLGNIKIVKIEIRDRVFDLAHCGFCGQSFGVFSKESVQTIKTPERKD